jgi:hypothetical protein
MSQPKAWQLISDQHPDAPPRLLEHFPVVLGRGPDCDIVLDDPTVEDLHLQVNADGGRLTLHDLQTRHGTRLNGKPITTCAVRRFPRRRFRLELGQAGFTLLYGPAAAGATTPARAGRRTEPPWYYARGDTVHGPLTRAELAEALNQGRVLPTDDVWQASMTARIKAFDLEAAPGNASRGPERSPLACPYCWSRFPAEGVFFIAAHPKLMGDPVLGDEEPRRFLPTRFTPEGLALDDEGAVCTDMACPVCHLRLPPGLLGQPPLFISIVGAPSSGKSFFLATSCWRLRQALPARFGLRFLDADAGLNRWLNDYEERLFLQADDQAFQTLAKTQMQGGALYRQVTLQGARVSLPLPCMFSLRPEAETRTGAAPARTLVFYDNAGEHFLPDQDSLARPGTQHLIHAAGIVFLYDPTKDPRFRKIALGDDAQLRAANLVQRQDVLLTEMFGRIRRHLGLRAGERYSRPLLVALSKSDVLPPDPDTGADPWSDGSGARLDLARLARVSDRTRRLFQELAPEVVQTAEANASSVLYLPISALGHSPTAAADGALAVRPRDVRPCWVEVPALYLLHTLGYVPGMNAAAAEPLPPEAAPCPSN